LADLSWRLITTRKDQIIGGYVGATAAMRKSPMLATFSMAELKAVVAFIESA